MLLIVQCFGLSASIVMISTTVAVFQRMCDASKNGMYTVLTVVVHYYILRASNQFLWWTYYDCFDPHRVFIFTQHGTFRII